MEVVRKIKKSKKRKQSSKSSKKEDVDNNLQERNSEDANKSEIPKEDVEKKIQKTVNELGRNQFIQTDLSCIHESEELLTEKDEQIKALNEKLQLTTNKLYESKNAYTALKLDFNKAQKLLCSEVGDNVSIAGLLNQPSGWRGRADQINQLQQKILELQQKIPETRNSRRESIERIRSTSSARLFDREKRQQIENLTKELKESEAALEISRKKIDAARARTAVLENELNLARKTVSLLNQKTNHDNQLIEALHNQLKAAETKYQDYELAVKRQNDKYEREIVLLKSEVEAAQLHAKNFKRQIDEKVKELEDLRSKSAAMNDRTVFKQIRMNSLNDQSPTSSPRYRDPNEFVAIARAAEAERERLLELVAVLNQRIDKEKCDYEQLSEELKKERSRGLKLEMKLQKLELERACHPRVRPGSYRQKNKKPPASPDNKVDEPEEIRLKFELLQEECLTLKTRLATVQKDKAADLAAFKKMLDETRKIFKDACRYNKANF